jgi:hypothetical protein
MTMKMKALLVIPVNTQGILNILTGLSCPVSIMKVVGASQELLEIKNSYIRLDGWLKKPELNILAFL